MSNESKLGKIEVYLIRKVAHWSFTTILLKKFIIGLNEISLPKDLTLRV